MKTQAIQQVTGSVISPISIQTQELERQVILKLLGRDRIGVGKVKRGHMKERINKNLTWNWVCKPNFKTWRNLMLRKTIKSTIKTNYEWN